MTVRTMFLAIVVAACGLSAAITGCSSSSSGPSPQDPGEVYGYVLDGLTAQPIEGATVTVDGEATTTDSLGYYIVDDVDPGDVTVEAVENGYLTLSTTVDVDEDESVRHDCVLVPATTGGEYRFVLTWNANPRDLDSHLWIPIGGRDYGHVYYGSRGSTVSEPYAELDTDEQSGYGPETMTVLPEHAGEYLYAVHHFTGTGTIATSGAVLRIYQGNVLRYTLGVPDEACNDNWWWNVCSFNAETGAFTLVDELQAAAPVTWRQSAK